MSISISNKTKAAIPAVDFDVIARTILGKKYNLNLTFIGDSEMRKYNRMYRNVDKTTDILSFPIGPSDGDILISPRETKKQAGDFDMNYDNFMAYLFIHGCAHLKGYEHGSKMDLFETKMKKRFHIE
ncbi:MAG: rRNA maturation RNase YbeY [Patescibacteria group bacterium]|nr:rRNA maturation RNase YbeY [Patescibacteria group bacterium]